MVYGTLRTVSPLLAPQTFSRSLIQLRSSRQGRQTYVLPPQSHPRGWGRRAPPSIIPSESVHSVSDIDSYLIKHQEHHGVKLFVYRRPDGDEMRSAAGWSDPLGLTRSTPPTPHPINMLSAYHTGAHGFRFQRKNLAQWHLTCWDSLQTSRARILITVLGGQFCLFQLPIFSRISRPSLKPVSAYKWSKSRFNHSFTHSFFVNRHYGCCVFQLFVDFILAKQILNSKEKKWKKTEKIPRWYKQLHKYIPCWGVVTKICTRCEKSCFQETVRCPARQFMNY